MRSPTCCARFERRASRRARSCRATGRPLFDADFRKPSALILGSEGAGVPEDVLQQVDRRITIPMQQPVESLNVGVAAALVLYEAYRQRNGTV